MKYIYYVFEIILISLSQILTILSDISNSRGELLSYY